VFQARLDREIQSGSIGAGLATRYDFSQHFNHIVPSAPQLARLAVREHAIKVLFRRKATEFRQELGRYSQGLGCCPGFHLQPMCRLVHRGQRLKERVCAGRHFARFF